MSGRAADVRVSHLECGHHIRRCDLWQARIERGFRRVLDEKLEHLRLKRAAQLRGYRRSEVQSCGDAPSTDVPAVPDDTRRVRDGAVLDEQVALRPVAGAPYAPLSPSAHPPENR